MKNKIIPTFIFIIGSISLLGFIRFAYMFIDGVIGYFNNEYSKIDRNRLLLLLLVNAVIVTILFIISIVFLKKSIRILSQNNNK